MDRQKKIAAVVAIAQLGKLKRSEAFTEQARAGFQNEYFGWLCALSLVLGSDEAYWLQRIAWNLEEEDGWTHWSSEEQHAWIAQRLGDEG